MFIIANDIDGMERIINLDNVEQILKSYDRTTRLSVKGFDFLLVSNRSFDELREKLIDKELLI